MNPRNGDGKREIPRMKLVVPSNASATQAEWNDTKAGCCAASEVH